MNFFLGRPKDISQSSSQPSWLSSMKSPSTLQFSLKSSNNDEKKTQQKSQIPIFINTAVRTPQVDEDDIKTFRCIIQQYFENNPEKLHPLLEKNYYSETLINKSDIEEIFGTETNDKYYSAKAHAVFQYLQSNRGKSTYLKTYNQNSLTPKNKMKGKSHPTLSEVMNNTPKVQSIPPKMENSIIIDNTKMKKQQQLKIEESFENLSPKLEGGYISVSSVPGSLCFTINPPFRTTISLKRESPRQMTTEEMICQSLRINEVEYKNNVRKIQSSIIDINKSEITTEKVVKITEEAQRDAFNMLESAITNIVRIQPDYSKNIRFVDSCKSCYKNFMVFLQDFSKISDAPFNPEKFNVQGINPIQTSPFIRPTYDDIDYKIKNKKSRPKKPQKTEKVMNNYITADALPKAQISQVIENETTNIEENKENKTNETKPETNNSPYLFQAPVLSSNITLNELPQPKTNLKLQAHNLSVKNKATEPESQNTPKLDLTQEIIEINKDSKLTPNISSIDPQNPSDIEEKTQNKLLSPEEFYKLELEEARKKKIREKKATNNEKLRQARNQTIDTNLLTQVFNSIKESNQQMNSTPKTKFHVNTSFQPTAPKSIISIPKIVAEEPDTDSEDDKACSQTMTPSKSMLFPNQTNVIRSSISPSISSDNLRGVYVAHPKIIESSNEYLKKRISDTNFNPTKLFEIVKNPEESNKTVPKVTNHAKSSSLVDRRKAFLNLASNFMSQTNSQLSQSTSTSQLQSPKISKEASVPSFFRKLESVEFQEQNVIFEDDGPPNLSVDHTDISMAVKSENRFRFKFNPVLIVENAEKRLKKNIKRAKNTKSKQTVINFTSEDFLPKSKFPRFSPK